MRGQLDATIGGLSERQRHDAMQTRAAIEQAKGILVGQRGCTLDQAFARLVKLSQDTHTSLFAVARSLIDENVGRALSV